LRSEKRLALPIEIDGGVNAKKLADVVNAGCDWIVTGSAVFHSADAEATVREFREVAARATAIRC
jgi:ribulose-phosphate 3-epimerase